MRQRSGSCILAIFCSMIGVDFARTEEPPLKRIRSMAEQGLSAAVVVDGRDLIHTTQLFPVDAKAKVVGSSAQEQLTALLQRLDALLDAYLAPRDHVVKLNLYVADSAVRNTVHERLTEWFGADALPAVAYVATALPYTDAKVALDAIIASKSGASAKLPERRRIDGLGGDRRRAHACVLPQGDVVYIAGQAEPGDLAEATRGTLEGLDRTLRHLGLDRQRIVELKCFVQPMEQIETVDREIARFFGSSLVPPVSHVEWISGSLPIEIELVAHAPPVETGETVDYVTLPWMTTSPVYSRVARIHGDRRIYVSGLYSKADGDGAEQVRDIFRSLTDVLEASGSDLRHLAKATYYVSSDDASRRLNELRPNYYDPKRPPAASKALVKGVGAVGRSITLDMIAAPSRSANASTAPVRTRVVKDTSTGDVRACRKMITGPGVNEHPPYPGCTGFIGWESVMRRANGEMLCSFSAGYWHVSFPSPIDIKPDLLASFQRGGFPKEIEAPTGGRALWCRSSDNGKTWSRPTTLVDTPGDDRHPVIVELPDGSLLAEFFVIDNWYGYDEPPAGRAKNSRVATIRSADGGDTWSEPVFMPSPFKYYDRMCGKPVVLPNGDVLLSTYGMDRWGSPVDLGIYRSEDGGRSWRFVSRLKASVKELDEPAICRAKDGRIVMIARPDGEIAFSKDEGSTWTRPQAFGVKMVAPCLLTLRDGTIACIFGWGATGGVQMMWSDDEGHTWTVPAPDRGFRIDDSVYVYAIGTEMPDGSIYLAYYDPRGNQRKTAIWGLRLRIRDDRQGIDLLAP